MCSFLRLLGVGAAGTMIFAGMSVSALAAPNAATSNAAPQQQVSSRAFLSGGRSVGPDIDIVDCNARNDFTEIFYGSGLNVICFANAGEWDGEIDGVRSIRTGNNAGRFIIQNSHGDFVQLFQKGNTFSFNPTVQVLTVHIN